MNVQELYLGEGRLVWLLVISETQQILVLITLNLFLLFVMFEIFSEVKNPIVKIKNFVIDDPLLGFEYSSFIILANSNRDYSTLFRNTDGFATLAGFDAVKVDPSHWRLVLTI